MHVPVLVLYSALISIVILFGVALAGAEALV